MKFCNKEKKELGVNNQEDYDTIYRAQEDLLKEVNEEYNNEEEFVCHRKIQKIQTHIEVLKDIIGAANREKDGRTIQIDSNEKELKSNEELMKSLRQMLLSREKLIDEQDTIIDNLFENRKIIQKEKPIYSKLETRLTQVQNYASHKNYCLNVLLHLANTNKNDELSLIKIWISTMLKDVQTLEFDLDENLQFIKKDSMDPKNLQTLKLNLEKYEVILSQMNLTDAFEETGDYVQDGDDIVKTLYQEHAILQKVSSKIIILKTKLKSFLDQCVYQSFADKVVSE